MSKLNVGDRVKPVCEKHSSCKKLRGEIIATRDDNFYSMQVKWDTKESPEWYSPTGLEKE